MKKTALVFYFLLSTFYFAPLALSQAPTTTNKGVTIDANGNVLPATVNGHVPNLAAGTTLGGAAIVTGTGLPSQTGNSGKYLTTNGTAASWATIDLSSYQTKAGVLALGGFSSITGRVGNANLPLGAQLPNASGETALSLTGPLLRLGEAGAEGEKTFIEIDTSAPSVLVTANSDGGFMSFHVGSGGIDISGTGVGIGSNTTDIVVDFIDGIVKMIAPNGVRLNATPLVPDTVNDGGTIGTNALPFPSFYLGNAATNNIRLTGTATSAKTITFPDATGTVMLLNGALGTPSSGTVTNLTGTASININGTVGATTPAAGSFTTLSSTGAYTNTKSGAASVSAGTYSGVPFAGTGTTSFPLLYLNDSTATASTTLSTAGTYLGVNGHGSADLMNLLLDGTSKFKVTSAGAGTFASSLSANTISSTNQITASSGNAQIYGPSDKVIRLSNAVGTGPTRINFTNDSNSFPAVTADLVNGLTLNSAAGTTTWNDPSTAGSGTVANRYLFGIAAPTLTATNSSVTDTVASTLYVGGAPTASTNTTIGTAWALNVAAGNTNLGGTVTIGGGTAVAKILSATATLDFGSTAAGAVSDLTITVTGAALGDVVSLGIPNASVPASGTFSAWVSSTNTVTVRYENNDLLTTRDPASGTFRVMVTQF